MSGLIMRTVFLPARDGPGQCLKCQAGATPYESLTSCPRQRAATTLAATTREEMPEHHQSFVDIRGCRINLLRGGKGSPLLYLHGGGGGGIWLPFLDKLAQRFDVLAPEHPGFGRSDTPSWLDNLSDLAYFYLDVLEALELERVHLVGHSFGGWIAA